MVNPAVCWPIPHCDELRLLVADGFSFSQSATLLNKKFGTSYTRNSCIGKAQRLGIEAEPKIKMPKMKKPKIRKQRVKPVLQLVAKPVPVMRCDPVTPLGLHLLDLDDNKCHWPYGEHNPYTFCGHPVFDGWPYCAAHVQMSIGYGTPSERSALHVLRERSR